MAKKPTNPLQHGFWEYSDDELWQALSPALLRIIMDGGRSGSELLPANLRVLVDWDWFNKAAVNYLHEWKLRILPDILAVTRDTATGYIDAWIKSGDPLPVLEQQLETLFGETRAKRIAVTETTRIYAKGNEMAWKSTNLVSGKRWNVAEDELVCNVCGELDSKVVALDNAFYSSVLRAGITEPPGHVNCRCWLTPVTTDEDLEKELERQLNE
jgi:SPP1 gp7 family putative phage head morphogenesis protein